MLSFVDYNMVRMGGVLYLYEEIINDHYCPVKVD